MMVKCQNCGHDGNKAILCPDCYQKVCLFCFNTAFGRCINCTAKLMELERIEVYYGA